MGFFDRIFHGKGGAHLPEGTSIVITEQGKEKLQEYGGDDRGRILLILETRGSLDSGEISKACGIGRKRVEQLIPALLRGGYVRFVTSGSVGDDL